MQSSITDQLRPGRILTDHSITTSQSPPAGTQAVARTLAILEVFVNHGQVGVTDVAQRVDLSPSTVHRIIQSLVAHGYLEQNPASSRYHLGRSAVVLGQAARNHRGLDLALPILEQLGAETDESVNMGLLDHHDVVVVLRVGSTQALRFDQPVGSRIPVHCSSMGKALLAFAGPEGPADIKGIAMAPRTEHSISSARAFSRDLKAVRGRGYSTDHQESLIGVSCVGAPVLDANEVAVSAIAIQAPTARMPGERMEELGSKIISVAATIADLMRPQSIK